MLFYVLGAPTKDNQLGNGQSDFNQSHLSLVLFYFRSEYYLPDRTYSIPFHPTRDQANVILHILNIVFPPVPRDVRTLLGTDNLSYFNSVKEFISYAPHDEVILLVAEGYHQKLRLLDMN